MIENWIDTLCEVWGGISDQHFGSVRSPYLIKKPDFPSSIDPGDLDRNPLALTIWAALQPKYAKGNKHLTWYGVTEFHVSPDLDKGRLPSLIIWPGLILRAAAAHVQLSGIVADFVIVDQHDGIAGPLALQYGNEATHWGFIVSWMVEESPDGAALPVSA